MSLPARCLIAVLFSIGTVLTGLTLPLVAAAEPTEAFDTVWHLTDQAVANGTAGYSWFWGPASFDQGTEQYLNSPGGARLVRYYDKSRMEINDPNTDAASPWYVSNGLLTVELVSGRLQVGDTSFEQRAASTQRVAGDPRNNPGTPSYAEFAPYTTTEHESNWSGNRVGQEVTAFLDGDGHLASTGSNGVRLSYFDDTTHHNVPDVFWAWMNDPASGFRQDTSLGNRFWVYVLGRPISEPYWINATVAGSVKRVLVQLYERRVLTYTAVNDPPFQVEFGNIGQHYYQWRYQAPPAGQTWRIQSVSSMKATKDRLCEQRDRAWIEAFVAKAVELGVTHISIEQPYDDPSCYGVHGAWYTADASAYTDAWVAAIRARGLNVWHRHTPLRWQGGANGYGEPKATDPDRYLGMIASYIQAHPGQFAEGDIFTPIPEPENGGIEGITPCDDGICQFAGASQHEARAVFNAWLRDAMSASTDAFASIGLAGKVEIGYFGFSGFTAWGDNNCDWDGILDDATVQAMGNIAIDHFPSPAEDPVCDEGSGPNPMADDLNYLEAKYPGVPIIIGEWGTITPEDPEGQVRAMMGAAARSSVKGFNYWTLGPEGNEALIEEGSSSFRNRVQFDEVRSFFRAGG